jgi:diadenylate cyclase
MMFAINWEFIGSAAVEILILFGLMYAVLRSLQGTRGAGILRGLVFVMILALLVILVLVGVLRLYRIQFLATGGLFAWVLVAVVVLFQPEIRRVFLRLGEYPLMRWFLKADSSVISEVVTAADRLSKLKMGGLIAMQREVSLESYIEGSTKVDAAVSADLIVTIFWPGSPLHDGAVVISHDRIVAAGCLFPLTESQESLYLLGTRHRAAIGVTEDTDAIAVVVSEETGQISAAYGGHITRGLDLDGLRRLLETAAAESPALEQRRTQA